MGASHFDESKAQQALDLIREFDTVSLARFRVVGTYVRYGEGVRNKLKDMKQKIVDGLQVDALARSHPIWKRVCSATALLNGHPSIRACFFRIMILQLVLLASRLGLLHF